MILSHRQTFSMSLDEDINRLYQLTPDQFTAARNELAKTLESTADKARVRALQKPSVPAWAVNQLFWRRRKVFQQLLESAKKVRAAHAQHLAGKYADLQAAERAQQDVQKDVANEIRDILKDAGELETPSTMNAVMETLQALPGREDYGRLVKPLKPLGFEALAGLVKGGGATIARLAPAKPKDAAVVATIAPARTGSRPADPAADAKRALQARRREIAEHQKAVAAVERELRKAAVAEREARTDYSRVELSLARVQRERKDLQIRIDELTVQRDELAVAFDEAKKDVERASSAREHLEARLRTMKSSKA
jgi:valyl-tRNA synthetase